MGSGITTFNYAEAAKLLLERSYPEIYNGTQHGPIFIPETFLPTYTRAVDPYKFQEKLEQFQSTGGINQKSFNDELGRFKGAFAERIFFDELQRVLNLRRSGSVCLNGSTILSPNVLKSGSQQECDFLIINKNHKYIMSLEIKFNLESYSSEYKPTVEKALEQLSKIKRILETFFSNDIDISKWKFVGIIGYVKMSDHVKCCSDCKPYIIQSSELKDLFNKIEADFGKINVEDDDDYKLIIRNLLYTIFSNPGPIVRSKVDEATFEKIQKHQGNYTNILFWTPSQFDLVKLDEENKPKFKNVLFISSFSTGKTEVTKGMMIKLLKAGKKVHYIICNVLTYKKPLLLLQTELMFEQDKELKQYKNNVHFSLVKNQGRSLSEDLQKLSEEVAKFPKHHTFVDEFVISLKKDDDGKVEQMMNQMKLITKVNDNFALKMKT